MNHNQKSDEVLFQQEIKVPRAELEHSQIDIIPEVERRALQEFSNFMDNRIPVNSEEDKRTGDIILRRKAYIFTPKKLKEFLEDWDKLSFPEQQMFYQKLQR